MPAHTPVDIRRLPDFCLQRGIRKLSLFGSALRGDFTPASDVDVLLEMEPEVDRQLTYFDLARLQSDLEQLVGRKVDVSLANALDKQLRDEILRSAEVLYDAA